MNNKQKDLLNNNIGKIIQWYEFLQNNIYIQTNCQILYILLPALRGNPSKKGSVDILTGYNLVFLLLQKIEELQKELQKYKYQDTKN